MNKKAKKTFYKILKNLLGLTIFLFLITILISIFLLIGYTEKNINYGGIALILGGYIIIIFLLKYLIKMIL